jgi:hypothetical protein
LPARQVSPAAQSVFLVQVDVQDGLVVLQM